jgi:hypothetical protein
LQSAFDEGNDLVSTSVRPDPVWIVFDDLEQCFVVIGQAKEITLFGDTIERAFMDQAVRLFRTVRNVILVFGLIRRTRCAEPAFVKSFEDRVVPFRRFVLRNLAPQMLNARIVKLLGRPHENIVAAVRRIESELRKHSFQLTRNEIGLFLRCAAFTLRRSLDIDPVLIRSGQKIDVESSLLLVPVDHVGDDRRVQMAKVRQAIGVIDRGCDVKSLHRKK